VEGGMLSAFSKAELRFPIPFLLPPVYAMKKLFTNCANYFQQESTLFEKPFPFS
jgi:hypothetical protein